MKSKQASPGEVPDSCELEQHPALLTAGRLGAFAVFLVSCRSCTRVSAEGCAAAVVFIKGGLLGSLQH